MPFQSFSIHEKERFWNALNRKTQPTDWKRASKVVVMWFEHTIKKKSAMHTYLYGFI